jgi:ABC-type transporter Mla MlaB component
MELYSEGTITHLQGDLTLAGVTLNIINSLAEALLLTTIAGEKNIQIVCDKIQSADVSGLQLLSVWMQCARFRGVVPELVNLPSKLKKDMLKLGMDHCFTGTDTKHDISVGGSWSRKILTFIQLRFDKYESLFNHSLSRRSLQQPKIQERRRMATQSQTRQNQHAARFVDRKRESCVIAG